MFSWSVHAGRDVLPRAVHNAGMALSTKTAGFPAAHPSRAIPVKSLQPSIWRGRLGVNAFTWGTLFCCLVLQRFAIPAGGLKISVATPLVLGLAAWALASGTLVIERRRMALYCGLCAVALFSVATQINLPLAMAPRMSLTSLYYWLAITAFAVLRFRHSVSETAFFRLVSLVLAALAVAGLVQFVLQFVGISFFSFVGVVPDQFLIEEQYNVTIPIDRGLNKSNGFFLVEPSVFSQFMAVGVVVEALYFRRAAFLALFFVALLSSMSGTGWMVVGSYIVVLAISAGRRGLIGAILLAAGCALAFAALSVALPDFADMMSGRVYEFTLPGTSGHERFVTPFLALQDLLNAAPWVSVTGVGPGASEQLMIPYIYHLNTPVKVLMEYGIFGLMLYLGLLTWGTRTKRQATLLAPLMVLLLLTGGYHQFSPILFAVLLIGTVAFVHQDEVRVN